MNEFKWTELGIRFSAAVDTGKMIVKAKEKKHDFHETSEHNRVSERNNGSRESCGQKGASLTLWGKMIFLSCSSSCVYDDLYYLNREQAQL